MGHSHLLYVLSALSLCVYVSVCMCMCVRACMRALLTELGVLHMLGSYSTTDVHTQLVLSSLCNPGIP